MKKKPRSKEEKIKAALDEIETICQMGPRVRYKIAEVLRKLIS